MPSGKSKNGFTPQEHLIAIFPVILVGLLILLATMLIALIEFTPETWIERNVLVAYGVLGSIYLGFFYLLLISQPRHRTVLTWINGVLGGISLGLLTLILPMEMDILLGVLMIVASISAALVSERGPAYFLVASTTLITLVIRWQSLRTLNQLATYLGMAAVAAITVETIQRLRHFSRQQINRLEIVNEFSRQLSTTLNTQQVTSLLNAAIQHALEADTYYVGMVEGDEILLQLFYDEGEYFTGVQTKMEGTLSGWVIRNQRGLFLPDLRHEVHLAGVKTVIIGKQKTSLSWMGVPMSGEFTNGVIAIASYRPNAFGRSDMELLSNMAQRAALALDNTFRHALVEEQTHIDSLTGVYNHGYFLKLLQDQAEIAQRNHTTLSLIMLDVDYFKQYNDTYGHLVGDQILTKLCETIRLYIKRTDSVGRWGGEEFVIALPKTTGAQAVQVANRIRETMATMVLRNNSQGEIPAPTVSQGIAQFPSEADEIYRLIDLADKRLYVAKERGRNQIEPAICHWDLLSDKPDASEVPPITGIF